MSRMVPRGTFRRSCRRCGWEGTYSTAGMADYSKRRHACDRRVAAAARSAGYAERLAQIDRTPKPCLHKVAQHQHGTPACYVLDKCRCIPCSRSVTARESERSRLQAYGRYDRYVDADKARAHIRGLMSQGMGLKRIVEVSDVSQGVLWKLLYGKRPPGRANAARKPTVRVLRTTEQRILAIELDLADGAKIDGADTARRIQALVACGWSMSKIAARLGILRSNFTPLAHGRRGVTVEHARAMHALYRELVNVEPPRATHRDKIAYTRSRGLALEYGWREPLRVNGRAWVGAAPGKEGTAA